MYTCIIAWCMHAVQLLPVVGKHHCNDLSLFHSIPDYSCALQKDILVQGRLYITQSYICFYANIFRWETVVCVCCFNTDEV